MNIDDLITVVQKDKRINDDILLRILAKCIKENKTEKDTFCYLYKLAYGPHIIKEIIDDYIPQHWSLLETNNIGKLRGLDWICFSQYDWNAAINLTYRLLYSSAKEFTLEEEIDFYSSSAEALFVKHKEKLIDAIIELNF